MKFYARRARRLLPALVVVLSAVWAFGWLILSAPELAALGKHLAAATVFANNVLLSSQSGYFDTPSAAKPLLHLWSLGVEEQFYLLVPLLLWLGSSARHASITLVARLSAASFLFTGLSVLPSFYLLHTRFWELGVGVALGYLALLLGSKQRLWERESWLPTCGVLVTLMLALLMVLAIRWYRDRDKWFRLSGRLQQHGALLRNGLSAAGIALIAMSFACVTPSAWGAPQTLLPVVSTGMVILAGSQSRGNILLASGPLPFVGGISYSLYLWHWPLIVYWRMLGMTHSGGDLMPVVLALILAWGTREFIERPARFGRLLGVTVWRPGLALVCTGLLVTGAMGVTRVASRGYPSRFSPVLTMLANWSIPRADDAWRVHRCFFFAGETGEFAAECAPPDAPACRAYSCGEIRTQRSCILDSSSCRSGPTSTCCNGPRRGARQPLCRGQRSRQAVRSDELGYSHAWALSRRTLS